MRVQVLQPPNDRETAPSIQRSVEMHQQLLKRISAGEAEAMQQLVDEFGPVLAQLIGRLTAWHVDSEDILQDVFLKVWQQAGTFRKEGSAEGWLKHIAINQCKNHFRSLAVWKRKLEQLVLLGVQQSVEPAIVYHEVDEELREGLSRLAPADRMAIVMFYLEEMPGEEVASALGIKLETLHVRLHRTRKKLKDIMNRESL